MRNRLSAVTAAGLVLAFAAGCGGSTPGQSTPPPDGGSTQTPRGPAAADSCTSETVPGAVQAVMTGTHEWAPSEFTITVGTTITWTNDTTAPHTVSFTTGPDCGYVLGGNSTSVTFDTPGTFNFNCKIYPTYMKGTVTVTE